MNTKLTLTQAIDGYLLHANARRLSYHTIDDYRNTYKKLLAYLNDDPPLDQIDPETIQEFLADQPVSSKTLLNYHTGLSALYTWALKENLVPTNILHQIDRPKPEKRAIIPYTLEDIKSMLNSLNETTYKYKGKIITRSNPNADRNRAIILLLLDTGLRATELCNLRIEHIDLKNRRLKTLGKGIKERYIPFSPRTGQALWKYLNTHPRPPSYHLFTTADDRPLTRERLLDTLESIGNRASVANVHPHRFRHTFAIFYLRNGGDPWSLQMILGHSTMEMVKTYLAIAQADLEANHQIASPVDHWRL